MTDDTEAALLQATEALSAARAGADREKRACLAQIAADLPTWAAEVAKRVATEQPEVTKALGKEGVAELRSALQSGAEEIARKLIPEADRDWMLGQDEYHWQKSTIERILFNLLYKETTGLKEVLRTRGYSDKYYGAPNPFLPQPLYRESDFSQLLAALTALSRASAICDSAKRDDDKDAVDTLWGD